MVWTCAKTMYQQTKKKDRKFEALLERLKKRARKTKENLKDKDMKNLDLQIEMVENQNEWRRRIHVDNHWD